MSLSRSDLEAGNDQTRLLEASHSGIKLTLLSEDELQRSLDETLQQQPPNSDTALPAAMRYILKSESFDRRGEGEKLYCIIAGSAVSGYLPTVR